MAQLAIKGDRTRGKEVISLFEMLGGINSHNLYGDENYAYYTIDGDKEIKGGIYVFGDEQLCHFTLEEFLEKFPYKIWDKVQHKGATSCATVYVIERMNWTNNHIEYAIRPLYDYNHTGLVTLCADELQPYKEENMEEKDEKSVNHVFSTEIISFEIAQKDKYELDLQGKFHVVLREGKYYVERIKPQYPKTYKECCRVVNANPGIRLVYDLSNGQKYSYDADNLQNYENIRRLLICRDAYWKIAGEQMGLGKPWRPDYTNSDIDLYVIINIYNRAEKAKYGYGFQQCILAFPTAEIRDAFYENFKELIEECKEFL